MVQRRWRWWIGWVGWIAEPTLLRRRGSWRRFFGRRGFCGPRGGVCLLILSTSGVSIVLYKCKCPKNPSCKIIHLKPSSSTQLTPSRSVSCPHRHRNNTPISIILPIQLLQPLDYRICLSGCLISPWEGVSIACAFAAGGLEGSLSGVDAGVGDVGPAGGEVGF
jgi:hypothetical protein